MNERLILSEIRFRGCEKEEGDTIETAHLNPHQSVGYEKGQFEEPAWETHSISHFHILILYSH